MTSGATCIRAKAVYHSRFACFINVCVCTYVCACVCVSEESSDCLTALTGLASSFLHFKRRILSPTRPLHFSHNSCRAAETVSMICCMRVWSTIGKYIWLFLMLLNPHRGVAPIPHNPTPKHTPVLCIQHMQDAERTRNRNIEKDGNSNGKLSYDGKMHH